MVQLGGGAVAVTGAESPHEVLVFISEIATAQTVTQLCAASSITFLAVTDVVAVAAYWRSATVVIVDIPGLRACTVAGLPKRARVVLIPEPDSDRLSTRSQPVAVIAELPGHSQELVDYLRGVTRVGAPQGVVLAVSSACGGAGATSLALAMAAAAVDGGLETVLIDADPLGYGVDAIVGVANGGGLGWSDFYQAEGKVASGLFRQSLPVVDGVGILGWRGAQAHLPDSASLGAVTDAAREAVDVTIFDLGRWFYLPTSQEQQVARTTLLARLDALTVVAPTESRGAFGCERILQGGLATALQPMLVTRGPSPAGLHPADLADGLQLRHIAHVDFDRVSAKMLDQGVNPGPPQRTKLARAARRVLRECLRTVVAP